MGQRGRKKGASGEESRALLLTIAAEEFANKGFYETKVSSIVKQANVTQPTFYLYFQSKEAIFQELIDSFRDQLFSLTKVSKLEPGIVSENVPAQITDHLASIFTFFKNNPDLTRIGFFLAVESEDIKRQLASQIKMNLDSEVQNGYFLSNLDTSLFAEMLVGAIERLTLNQLFQGKETPENLAAKMVRLFLYGVSRK
ncbi:TetR/AcrR family transcriptional regulator [Heyndrickxia vini]|uniref:TetR/AcrR family transcriptional regulator n=1 Tax=Heyndrickxia vini TaxID=1476025 RepID=A0ABX7E3Y9_9BACI|nr:TetR/AcrR family transcriptional regulator [Heyndrickxia vini]QQZ10035.1 TetR/AcrR family transcriptional regulator [Heyndrickxia vini]